MLVMGLAGLLAGSVIVNYTYCKSKAQCFQLEKRSSTEYQEYLQAIEQIHSYETLLEGPISGWLTEEGKIKFQEKFTDIKDKKLKLYESLSEYDKKTQEWLEKAKNPLKHFGVE